MMAEHSDLQELRSEITVVWKIRNFLYLLNKRYKPMDSPPFLLTGSQWFIRIVPNVIPPCCPVSVFLYRKQASSAVNNVFFKFCIKRSDGLFFKSYEQTHDFESIEWQGCWNFFTVSELYALKNLIFSGDTLNLYCNIRNNSHADNSCFAANALTQTVFPERADCLAEDLKTMLINERDTDITINVRDRKFKAHKLILTARSPVFKSMFDHNTLEKKSGVINIQDSDPEFFPDFLLFLYTGKIDHVTSSNAPTLYKLADKYDVNLLKEKSSACMGHELTTDSLCDVALIASLYNDSSLMNFATNFFMVNMKKVLLTPKWLAFLTEEPLLANDMLIAAANKN